MMMKLGLVIGVYFAVHATLDDACAADANIRSVELKSLNDDIGRIGSLYNSTWSVVAKCCPVGQLLRYEGSDATNPSSTHCKQPLSNETIIYSPLFTPFNETGMLVPAKTREQFVAVVGNPCKYEMFELDPEIDEDEYVLLANGSIYTPRGIPQMKAPGRDYCMELVAGRGLTVLVCLEPELTVVRADTRLAFYAVGLLTSVPFLLATIFAYSITRQLRDVYGMALCCYSGCLAIAFLTLAVLQLAGHLLDINGCDGIAFVIQFSFIACFFWLNIMTVEMWQLVRRYEDVRSALIRDGTSGSNRRFFYYSLWGWGLPAVLIVVSLVKNLQPIIPWTYVKRSGDEDPSCWFGLEDKALFFFYVPVGFLVLANAILFTITGVKIAQIQRDLDLRRVARNEPSDRQDRRVFRELRLTFVVTLVLFLIMGVNWSMELISVLAESDLLAWSIFDFINALQGVLVFGLFVLRKPARSLVWCRIKRISGCRERELNNDTMNEVTLLPINNDINNTIISPSRILNQ